MFPAFFFTQYYPIYKTAVEVSLSLFSRLLAYSVKLCQLTAHRLRSTPLRFLVFVHIVPELIPDAEIIRAPLLETGSR